MFQDTGSTAFAPSARALPEQLEKQRLLIEADAGFISSMETLPHIVMLLNQQRQIIYGNRAFRNLCSAIGVEAPLGLRPGEMLSCHMALNAASGCGTGEACKSCGAVLTILDALSGREGTNECRIMRDTGMGMEAMDLRVWGAHFKKDGEVFAILVASDISNEKRRQVLERTFFHDVMNIASALNGIATLLEQGDMTVDEALEPLVETSRILMDEIISQRELLAAENNELKPRPVIINAGKLLNKVKQTCRFYDYEREKQIQISGECADVDFISDEVLLTRVLVNLTKNALEASLPEQLVTLGSHVTATEISFWVHNEMPIPKEIQLQLFMRSFSTKGKGRGIGTYSVKLLAENYLKGHVSFVSSFALGTTFTVTLPLEKAQP